MKIGLDAYTLFPLRLTPAQMLEKVEKLGFSGVQWGELRSLSRDLNFQELRSLHASAEARGLYTYVSVPCPNPHVGARKPDELIHEISAQIKAAAECGWHELHSALGSEQNRYDSSTPWKTQLTDSVAVFEKLRPVLRHYDSRINLETHGDTTTFELVRLVEQVGPEIAGICLDTANVLCFGEDPLEAVHRAAPFTHLTHTKDAIIYLSKRGYTRQGRPPGQGIVPWEEALSVLGKYSPHLPLSIEDHKFLYEIPVFETEWHSKQTDLSRAELLKTMQIAWRCTQQIACGELPDPIKYEAIPYANQMNERLSCAREHLQQLLRRLRLDTNDDI